MLTLAGLVIAVDEVFGEGLGLVVDVLGALALALVVVPLPRLVLSMVPTPVPLFDLLGTTTEVPGGIEVENGTLVDPSLGLLVVPLLLTEHAERATTIKHTAINRFIKKISCDWNVKYQIRQPHYCSRVYQTNWNSVDRVSRVLLFNASVATARQGE